MRLTELDGLRSVGEGLESGCANLVDGRARDVDRDSCVIGREEEGVLASFRWRVARRINIQSSKNNEKLKEINNLRQEIF